MRYLVKKCLFIFLFSQFSFSSWPLPYERNCSKGQKERTSQFSFSRVEAKYCFGCKLLSSIDSMSALDGKLEIISKYDTIPKDCFLAIAVRGNQIFEDRYNYCSSENNRKHLAGWNQRFCINKDYITAIHETFKKMSYCFNFDKETQKDIFYMINHESGGILNSRSPTKARCLGQITKDYVEMINRIIGSANRKNPHSEAFIWKDILAKCPDLESARINKLRTINCEATQNPEKCLLYSFFGKKRSFYSIQKGLDSPHSYMGNRQFPKAEDFIPSTEPLGKQRYQNMLSLFPIKGKEMLVVKAALKDGRKVSWVIWDDSEVYNNNLHRKIDWTQEADIRKVNMFQNERNIRSMFMYWSHNGGETLSRDGFTERLKRLKYDIAKGGCKENNQELRCQMRRRVENGGGVPNYLALNYFKRDLRRTYRGKFADKRRKAEVADYVNNIIDERDIAFDYSNSKNRNLLLMYHENNGIDRETAKQFIEDADQRCPKALDIQKDTSGGI